MAETSVLDLNMGGVLTGDVKNDWVQLHLNSPSVDEALLAALLVVLSPLLLPALLALLVPLLLLQQQVHRCDPWLRVFSKSSSWPMKLKLGEMLGLQRLT